MTGKPHAKKRARVNSPLRSDQSPASSPAPAVKNEDGNESDPPAYTAMPPIVYQKGSKLNSASQKSSMSRQSSNQDDSDDLSETEMKRRYTNVTRRLARLVSADTEKLTKVPESLRWLKKHRYDADFEDYRAYFNANCKTIGDSMSWITTPTTRVPFRRTEKASKDIQKLLAPTKKSKGKEVAKVRVDKPRSESPTPRTDRKIKRTYHPMSYTIDGFVSVLEATEEDINQPGTNATSVWEPEDKEMSVFSTPKTLHFDETHCQIGISNLDKGSARMVTATIRPKDGNLYVKFHTMNFQGLKVVHVDGSYRPPSQCQIGPIVDITDLDMLVIRPPLFNKVKLAAFSLPELKEYVYSQIKQKAPVTFLWPDLTGMEMNPGLPTVKKFFNNPTNFNQHLLPETRICQYIAMLDKIPLSSSERRQHQELLDNFITQYDHDPFDIANKTNALKLLNAADTLISDLYKSISIVFSTYRNSGLNTNIQNTVAKCLQLEPPTAEADESQNTNDNQQSSDPKTPPVSQKKPTDFLTSNDNNQASHPVVSPGPTSVKSPTVPRIPASGTDPAADHDNKSDKSNSETPATHDTQLPISPSHAIEECSPMSQDDSPEPEPESSDPPMTMT